MENERFASFTHLICGIYKCINKIKIDTAPYFGIKGVHIFWIYSLFSHPEGMTASELAANSMIDRSLVSREIEKLRRDGYISCEGGSGKSGNYNSRLILTEKGIELAEVISREALTVQNSADEGISEEELVAFYKTLRKLNDNFMKITKERELQHKQKKQSER